MGQRLSLLIRLSSQERLLRQARALRFIGTLSTGYNTVDLEAADERQIPVSNIPSYSTQAVAQLTMALLLEICHHVGAHSAQVMAGKWSSCPDFCFWSYPSMELAGKTMGIIGYGNIGQAVARLAVAFGMNVIANVIMDQRRTYDRACTFSKP